MKNAIYQSLLAGFAALACAINAGIVLKEWLSQSADTYANSSQTSALVVVSVVVVGMCAFLTACVWLLIDESEKYGYWK